MSRIPRKLVWAGLIALAFVGWKLTLDRGRIDPRLVGTWGTQASSGPSFPFELHADGTWSGMDPRFCSPAPGRQSLSWRVQDGMLIKSAQHGLIPRHYSLDRSCAYIAGRVWGWMRRQDTLLEGHETCFRIDRDENGKVTLIETRTDASQTIYRSWDVPWQNLLLR